MSRTKPTQQNKNPAKLYIEWSSDNKSWKTYDREKKEEVLLPIGIPFILLDQLNSVGGFSDRHGKSYYGTEVRSPSDPITVFMNKKVELEGPWKEIKEKERDLSFVKSVYALAKIDDEYVTVNFSMKGSCVGSWFDFVEKVGINTLEGDAVIAVTGTTHDKKGKTEYDYPNFEIVTTKLSDEAAEKAVEADTELQKYLEVYLKADHSKIPEDDSEQEQDPEDEAALDAERERQMEDEFGDGIDSEVPF